MPIKGMTTAHQPGAGLPRLGKLVKGAERTQEDLTKKRPGRDLQHFRIKFDPGYEHLAATWTQLYGDEPTIIPRAFLMSDAVDAAFQSWLEEWSASGLLRRCDGEQQVRWFNRDEGRTVSTPIPCANSSGQTCQCKQVGRLNFILPDLISATGAFGYITLETHSVIDIKRFFQTLKDVEALYGRTTGIPFVLVRLPEEIEQPKFDKATKKPTGERMRVTKYLIQLRLDETFVRQQMIPALSSGVEAVALPARVDMSSGEIVSIPALPSANEPRGPQWTEAQAKAWVNRISTDYSLSLKDILTALGVDRLGAWTGSDAEASLRVDAWMDEVLSGEQEFTGELHLS